MDVELARQILGIETEMVQLGIITLAMDPKEWPAMDPQTSDAQLMSEAREALPCIRDEMMRLAPGDCTVAAMQWCQRSAAVLSRYAEQIAAEVSDV